MQNGRSQDQKELLRFGLNFMLFTFDSRDHVTVSQPASAEGTPTAAPPGLSLSDVDELTNVCTCLFRSLSHAGDTVLPTCSLAICLLLGE